MRFTFLVILFVNFILLNAQDQNNEIQAKIVTEQMDNSLQIKAQAFNSTPLYYSLNYSLLSLKKGETGNINSNKQEGKFTLQPEESKTLSQLQINIEPQDALKVYLFVRDDKTNQLISKDSLVIGNIPDATLSPTTLPGKRRNRVTEKDVQNAGLMSGLVIEETKTKVGKDFYDKFFMDYQMLPQKFPFIVKITEIPTTGRTTQIDIYAQDEIVYTFISNPSLDYIEDQSRRAMYILKRLAAKQNLLYRE